MAGVAHKGRPYRPDVLECLSLCGRVHALVDAGDLLDPVAPVAVLHAQNLLHGPVEVIRDVGYLLLELLEGVADYPPTRPMSISKRPSQCGQVTSAAAVPVSLMRR